MCVCVCVCASACEGGKEGENEEISHIKHTPIQHSAIIETANALERQRNPRCQIVITCD